MGLPLKHLKYEQINVLTSSGSLVDLRSQKPGSSSGSDGAQRVVMTFGWTKIKAPTTERGKFIYILRVHVGLNREKRCHMPGWISLLKWICFDGKHERLNLKHEIWSLCIASWACLIVSDLLCDLLKWKAGIGPSLQWGMTIRLTLGIYIYIHRYFLLS